MKVKLNPFHFRATKHSSNRKVALYSTSTNYRSGSYQHSHCGQRKPTQNEIRITVTQISGRRYTTHQIFLSLRSLEWRSSHQDWQRPTTCPTVLGPSCYHSFIHSLWNQLLNTEHCARQWAHNTVLNQPDPQILPSRSLSLVFTQTACASPPLAIPPCSWVNCQRKKLGAQRTREGLNRYILNSY